MTVENPSLDAVGTQSFLDTEGYKPPFGVDGRDIANFVVGIRCGSWMRCWTGDGRGGP